MKNSWGLRRSMLTLELLPWVSSSFSSNCAWQCYYYYFFYLDKLWNDSSGSQSIILSFKICLCTDRRMDKVNSSIHSRHFLLQASLTKALFTGQLLLFLTVNSSYHCFRPSSCTLISDLLPNLYSVFALKRRMLSVASWVASLHSVLQSHHSLFWVWTHSMVWIRILPWI